MNIFLNSRLAQVRAWLNTLSRSSCAMLQAALVEGQPALLSDPGSAAPTGMSAPVQQHGDQSKDRFRGYAPPLNHLQRVFQHTLPPPDQVCVMHTSSSPHTAS